ncbi:hypothetical protein M408DRAFT_13618 [Serendipita vermifera MAFF 305830]|uniref:Copper transport protein n=1 Tax=Serendipita vermifera MAFF 305830 TaxID=933852 RepID=A0A0C2XYG0_SERVB|nr:hypothetical protein M408DRAFT_13618 [Serendipita vermifera MAFF 305830]
MDGDSSDGTGMMVPWLHFTPGDTLLFQDWVPTEPGPIFGACVGLFMLAIVDRWLAALRRFMEIWWAERARVAISGRFIKLRDKSRSEEDKIGAVGDVSDPSLRDEQAATRRSPATAKLSRNAIPPFIASHDFVRGAFVVVQTAITYALMLTVMTFNAGFIIAILVGLGTGEVLFGRLAYTSFSHADH